jgi:peroxiredoxin
LLALLLAGATSASAADRAAPLPVGERAPDVALADQHGKPFQLAEAFKQRDFVVLAFYVKAFTGG